MKRSFLKNREGNPVHDLEINLEKLLLLIIVDDRLQTYYHLHPEETRDGEFKAKAKLPDGLYKAFLGILSIYNRN